MQSTAKVRLVVVGLGFGAEFLPIYQNHPDVEEVAICDLNPERLASVGDRFNVARRFSSFDEVVSSDDYNAVHLLTPVPLHAEQTIRILESGKHCACAVVMGTTMEELRAIVAVQLQTGKNYMMMETAAYTREFLYVKNLYQKGELGSLTFLRGWHMQNLEGYPAYWYSQPPMHYATHAVGAVLALTGGRFSHVSCMGSGRLSPNIQRPGGNPFRLETGLFRVANSDLAAEITRCDFETARQGTENFSVYGDAGGFEWQQSHDGKHQLYTLEPYGGPGHMGRRTTVTPLEVPNITAGLPQEIASFGQAGWYRGSQPHLVHEFVRSIVEERAPAIDAVTSANWCAAGLCAHESALRDGETVVIPDFGAQD